MKTTLVFKNVHNLVKFAQAQGKGCEAYTNKVIPPAIYFVKDQGIYVMPSYVKDPLVSAESPEFKNLVIYAEGFNPKKDDNVQDKARQAVGGSDLAVAIDVSSYQFDGSSTTTLTLKIEVDDVDEDCDVEWILE